MAGFLVALVDLDAYLGAEPGQSQHELRAMFIRRRAEMPGVTWEELTKVFRNHIRETIPGGVKEVDR